MNDNRLMNLAADNIRILAASMVEKAKSGHPGGAMGGADFINIGPDLGEIGIILPAICGKAVGLPAQFCRYLLQFLQKSVHRCPPFA